MTNVILPAGRSGSNRAGGIMSAAAALRETSTQSPGD
jgi:hypothetical protein